VSESARQKELEAELERRTKQLENDLADATTEKSRLQEALDAAEAAVKENELAVAQRADELERLTGELERLTSVVEQERASSSDLRAELEQQRQQLATHVSVSSLLYCIACK
jgi:chromosome segregation ATPase